MQYHSNQISFQVYKNQELPFQYDQNLLIFFGLRGTSRILCDNTSYELEPSGVLVVNPFELYRIICPQTSSMICLRIAHSLLQLSGWQDTLYCSCYERADHNNRDEYNTLRSLYAFIFQEFFQNSKNHAGYISSVLQLTGLLQSHFSVNDPSRSRREQTLVRVKRILDRIHTHWNEELSLSEIAEKEYMSVSYLSRFFKKHLHTTFSQYLTDLRLRHAAQALVQSSDSITQIAYNCGFRSPSAFIESFKHYYHQTPKAFRQEQHSRRNMETVGVLQSDSIHDMKALLTYLPAQPTSSEPSNRTLPVSINCAVQQRLSGWRRMLNIGYARDGLLAPVQEQIKRAQTEIGFEFIRFHGILDEDMHVYLEDENGNPQFCFSYVNMLFDFLLSLGLTPYVELSFMPAALAREQTKIFDRHSIFSGCTDLKKWNALVTAVLRNFIERYGKAEVRRWKFTTISRSYMHLGCILPEDYDALYIETYRAVKAVDPLLQFGGPGCFAYLITESSGIPAFLDFARKNDCLPDFIAIQCYPHNQSAEDDLFMDLTLTQQSAPSILSDDVDFLPHALDALQALLSEKQFQPSDIVIEECTSTLWQRDLSGDTCYKAAWMAKNICGNADRAVFGYWMLTDFMEERAFLESVFHGGYGLFTYNGIPKAGYYALQLASRLGNQKVSEGNCWFLTREADSYQLLLYNYCHYSNMYRLRYKRLEKPQDAYTVFEPGEILRLQFHLKDIPDGTYRMEQRAITRKNSSAFDRWIELGAPRCPRLYELQDLKRNAQPQYSISDIQAQNGMRFEILLRPLETMLITFQLRE